MSGERLSEERLAELEAQVRSGALVYDDVALALIAEARRARRLEAALERIEGLTEHKGDPCVCGLKPEFCHRRNADKWCGGTTTPAVWIARAALAEDEEARP